MTDMPKNLKLVCTKDEIKSEVTQLLQLIKMKQAEIKILQSAIKHYQDQCDHEGQETGCNYRDGSWGNACPTCQYSY